MHNISLIDKIFIIKLYLMYIALLPVVNSKSDIIDRTQCNYMTWLLYIIYIVTCSNLVFYYQFIHKHFVHKRINL